MGKLDLFLLGILHVAFGSMPHLPEDAKVTAFAQVIWPDPKASCIKFIDGEYELYDSVLSNGFDVIDNTPNANEHILSALKRYDHLRREYSFYIGELDGNYVIYRDVYQEPNKYECADLRPISELPKLSTEPNLETEVFTQEQAIATTPKPLLRTTATLSPRPTVSKAPVKNEKIVVCVDIKKASVYKSFRDYVATLAGAKIISDKQIE